MEDSEKLRQKLVDFKNSTDENEKEKLWKDEISQLIKKVIFFVGMGYEGDDLNAPVFDPDVHCFPGAATRIQSEGILPDLGPYSLSQTASTQIMHFRTLKNPMLGEEWLSAFTSFDEMLPVWAGRCHFALATFDDMKNFYKPSMGILINCMSGCFRLPPEKIEYIDKGGKQD